MRFYTPNGKFAGIYNEEEKVFVAPRKISKHFMHKFGGFGLDVTVLSSLDAQGCKTIVIQDTELKNHYTASIKTWLNPSLVRRATFGNHGTQNFLSVHRMKKEPYN